MRLSQSLPSSPLLGAGLGAIDTMSTTASDLMTRRSLGQLPSWVVGTWKRIGPRRRKNGSGKELSSLALEFEANPQPRFRNQATIGQEELARVMAGTLFAACMPSLKIIPLLAPDSLNPPNRLCTLRLVRCGYTHLTPTNQVLAITMPFFAFRYS